MYSQSVSNTLYVKIKHVKKISFRQNRWSKKIPSFFCHELQLITVLLLICDSYMSWSTRFVSLKLCVWFCFTFNKVYIFVQQNAWTLWLWNVTIHFKIKIMEKPHTVLLPDPWFLNYDKNRKIQYLRELELPKNWTGDKFFEFGKSKFWQRQFFVATFK